MSRCSSVLATLHNGWKQSSTLCAEQCTSDGAYPIALLAIASWQIEFILHSQTCWQAKFCEIYAIDSDSSVCSRLSNRKIRSARKGSNHSSQQVLSKNICMWNVMLLHTGRTHQDFVIYRIYNTTTHTDKRTISLNSMRLFQSYPHQ